METLGCVHVEILLKPYSEGSDLWGACRGVLWRTRWQILRLMEGLWYLRCNRRHGTVPQRRGRWGTWEWGRWGQTAAGSRSSQAPQIHSSHRWKAFFNLQTLNVKWRNVEWIGLTLTHIVSILCISDDDAGDCMLHGLESLSNKDQTLCWWGDICTIAREYSGLWCFLGATNLSSCKRESDGATDHDWCLPPSICQDYHSCYPILWLCKSWPQSKLFDWYVLRQTKEATCKLAVCHLYQLSILFLVHGRFGGIILLLLCFKLSPIYFGFLSAIDMRCKEKDFTGFFFHHLLWGLTWGVTTMLMIFSKCCG